MEDREQDRLIGEPFLLVRFHHPPRLIVARIVGVGEQAADMIAPAHVAVLRFLEEAREQRQRQRMAAEIMRGRAQLPVDPPHVIVAQKLGAGLVRQPLDVDDRRGAVLEAPDVGDRDAAGQHDQAVVRSRRRGGEMTQQRAQALVLEFARLRTRPMLQRLDAVEHEQNAPRHQRGSAIASPLAEALVVSTFRSSLASAQSRNASAAVARSFEPWL